METVGRTSFVPSPPPSSLTSFSTLLALDATEAAVEDLGTRLGKPCAGWWEGLGTWHWMVGRPGTMCWMVGRSRDVALDGGKAWDYVLDGGKA